MSDRLSLVFRRNSVMQRGRNCLLPNLCTGGRDKQSKMKNSRMYKVEMGGKSLQDIKRKMVSSLKTL